MNINVPLESVSAGGSLPTESVCNDTNPSNTQTINVSKDVNSAVPIKADAFPQGQGPKFQFPLHLPLYYEDQQESLSRANF